MTSEKYWPDVILTPIGVSGVKFTTVPDTIDLRVKMLVTVNAPAQQPLILEIKRVVDKTTIMLGRPDKAFADFVQPTAYVGGTITVQHAEKYKIGPEYIIGAVYEREPVVAMRTTLVDPYGDRYSTQNPLPVQLSDGSINIGTVNAELEVFLTHLDDFPEPGEIHDSIRIGDGTDLLEINSDGSINVQVVNAAADSVLNFYDQANSVATMTETEIVSYTVPPGKFLELTGGSGSGDCDGTFKLKIDNNIEDLQRNAWTERNIRFFGPLIVPAASKVSITVEHCRPDPHDFQARITGYLRDT